MKTRSENKRSTFLELGTLEHRYQILICLEGVVEAEVPIKLGQLFCKNKHFDHPSLKNGKHLFIWAC